ncbi:ATP-dependent DNA helicase RecG [Candidatus Desantisbacteria bacterium]|nr:ATP-dependent DNA helicase RecG [Candidatus Desantisbacteria bacterium]
MNLLHELDKPIQYLKGVGEAKAKKFEFLGIKTVYDLLTYYPRDYQDRSKVKPIFSLQDGQRETFSGMVIGHAQAVFHRKGIKLIKTCVSDGTGYVYILFFGQSNMDKILPPKSKVFVTGRIRRYRGEIQSTDFEYEVIDEKERELLHTNRIVPIYPLNESVPSSIGQRMIRQAVSQAFLTVSNISDMLPDEIIMRQQLSDYYTALKNIHLPQSHEEYKKARKRLVFDEFFLLQLAFGISQRRIATKEKGIQYSVCGNMVGDFINSLPFTLTGAQKRVIKELLHDMSQPVPMNRLLHGDVGSGKTVVAACAALTACENGYQTAFMSPTEILAQQHFLTLEHLLHPLKIRLGLLTGSTKKRQRDSLLAMVKDGEIDILIGTHSLIQDAVAFKQLGLCIIDEQHRFGVVQRSTLKGKARDMDYQSVTPDILVMTATPIPRTLALTLYGDLETSVIDELPPNRQLVITRCRSEQSMDKIFSFIRQEILDGRQAYIVYPLIEESEEIDLKAATTMFEELKGVFPEWKLGLLHGQMKMAEKNEVMTAFYNKQINILVSTTVIEVGIDVPNATIMLIEHAQRFGLAQLHQLRGRVGRGANKSYCILMADKKIADLVNSSTPISLIDDPTSTIFKGTKRLKTMCETNDGFRIAEVDLEIRGPGEFFGIRQHGMPELKIANIIYDARVLEIARKEAFDLIRNDPYLTAIDHQALKKTFFYEFRDRLELGSVG